MTRVRLNVQDCKDCECDVGGSTSANCNKVTGACDCRPYLTERQCTQPVDSFYIPSVDALSVEPTSPSCQTRVDLSRSNVIVGADHFLICGEGDVVSFNDISVTLPQPNITGYVQ